MKYYYVIGNTASKSLSPLIFNHWFKKYKIEAKYSFIEVSKSKFNLVLKQKILDKMTAGLNITIPYKKDIIKHLDTKSQHAEKIGAVNCVTIKKKIRGTNTDWAGYLKSIKNKKINKNKNILILGYGGASQAIVYAFHVRGFKNVSIFNRSKKAINYGQKKKYTKKYSLINKHIKKADLIINTTPTNPLSADQAKLVRQSTVISDIVYKPKLTKFLKSFEKNEKIYGISMLTEQAAICFQEWFGFHPKLDQTLIKKLNTKTK